MFLFLTSKDTFYLTQSLVTVASKKSKRLHAKRHLKCFAPIASSFIRSKSPDDLSGWARAQRHCPRHAEHANSIRSMKNTYYIPNLLVSTMVFAEVVKAHRNTAGYMKLRSKNLSHMYIFSNHITRAASVGTQPKTSNLSNRETHFILQKGRKPAAMP